MRRVTWILRTLLCLFFVFFFQAEDGIRDLTVTGVQTCALPICMTEQCPALSCTCFLLRQNRCFLSQWERDNSVCWYYRSQDDDRWCRLIGHEKEIGRASCRERV